MATDIQTYLRELQAALAAAGGDPALVQDALFDAEEHLQAEMAAGGALERGTATYESRFAEVVEGYGSPEEVAAAYLGIAPPHEVVAAYQTVLANGTAAAYVAAESAPAIVTPEPPATPPAMAETVAAVQAPTAAETVAADQGETRAAVEQPTLARRHCMACGNELRAESAFCTACGARVPAPVRQASEGLPTAVLPAGTPPTAVLPAAALPAGTPQVAPPAGVQAGMAASAAGAGAPPGALRQVFGVFADPAVYKALVYMILSLGTGIAYFTIVVAGVATFTPLLIMIIGIPLFLLFLGVVRGISLFEGRLVEWLLGVRMPRRPRSAPPNTGIIERIAFWLKDSRTWASMVYLSLMLPLGIAYFTIAVTGLATGIGLLASPLWAWAGWVGEHTFVFEGVTYYWTFPAWGVPLAMIGGVVLLVAVMHVTKWIGRGHAVFAKAMLVRLDK